VIASEVTTVRSVKIKEAENDMDWSTDGWRSAFRIELRVEAIGFASRGWPVVPGTYPTGSRWGGRDGHDEERLTPVHRDWDERLGTYSDQVDTWWSGNTPYSLLVATGTAVDAFEVDAALGRRAATALRALDVPVPIVATPDRRWYFLTSAGHRASPEPTDATEVRFHGVGSWVPMPPTTLQHGLVHWRVNPEVCGWRLPAPELVHDALCTAIRGSQDVANLVPAVS
jgi:hypothetical protein